MKDILQYILNKNPEKQFFTGAVSSLSPLQVKLFPDDSAITCKSTTGLLGLSVGSNVIMMRIGSQFIITQIVGNPFIDSIILNRNSTQTITTTDQTKVEFNSQKIILGSRLSFDSTNKGVLIGKGVNAVSIIVDLWTQRTSGSYSSIHIYKNSTQLTYSIYEGLWTIQHSNTEVEVTENDLIYTYIRFSSSHASENIVAGGYPDSCNMIVKAIS